MSSGLSSMTNEQLYQLYATSQDEKYLNIILEKNMKQVFQLANRHREGANTIEIQDLEQEGLLGYRNGLLAYKPEGGASVNTFCFYYVQKAIGEYIDNYQRIVRFPKSIREKAKKFETNGGPVGNESWQQSTYNLINGFTKGDIDIDLSGIEVIDPEFRDNEFKYDLELLKIIVEPLDKKEKSWLYSILNEENLLFMDEGYTPQMKGILSKIKKIYNEIKKKVDFVRPLQDARNYLMDSRSYRFWQQGKCEFERYKYPAHKLYMLEKRQLGFTEERLRNGDVLLKLSV